MKVYKDFIKAIKNDPEMFRVYRDNIAMAFKDEYYFYKKQYKRKYMNEADIHRVANNAARYFLGLLTKDIKGK